MTFRSACRILAISWGLVSTGSAIGDELPFSTPGGGGLVDYLVRAQSFNPRLKAFEQRYLAAMQRAPQVSSLPDPQLQVTWFVDSVQTRTGPQQNIFVLSQKVPWFGKLTRKERVASAEAEAVWYAYQNQQLLLVRAVAEAFFEYGYTKEAIRLTQENRDLLRKLEPIVEEKVKSGGDLNALLRLKVEIGRVDDRWQTLQQTRVMQSAQLREMLALPGPECCRGRPRRHRWHRTRLDSRQMLR